MSSTISAAASLPANSVSSSVVSAASDVTEATLRECEESARFWSGKLPSYGQRMRNLADRFAIIGAGLAAVTSLTIWGTLADSNQLLAVVAVSIMSIATALVTAVPKIKGWAECAGAAPGLASKYGHAIGELQDARVAIANGLPGADKQAAKARDEFEAVRKEKEYLKPFPTDLQAEIESLRRSHR
jgi:hypothetical protein